MNPIQKVVIIGASGALGSNILKIFQTNSNFDITVLSRLDSQAKFSDGFKVIRTNYDYEHLEQIFQGQDAVVCASNLAAITQQKVIIDACVATGVRRYITNDFGHHKDFAGLPELDWAKAPRDETREYAQQQAQSHKNFTWSSLAVGHFIDHAILEVPVFMGFHIPERLARLIDGGAEPFSMTTTEDIAIAILGILNHLQKTANRYLLVRTLETTQLAILKSFESQTGAKWKVEHESAKILYEAAKQKTGRAAILDFLTVQAFEEGARRWTLPKERYDNELLGVTEKSVEDVVQDILARAK